MRRDLLRQARSKRGGAFFTNKRYSNVFMGAFSQQYTTLLRKRRRFRSPPTLQFSDRDPTRKRPIFATCFPSGAIVLTFRGIASFVAFPVFPSAKRMDW